MYVSSMILCATLSERPNYQLSIINYRYEMNKDLHTVKVVLILVFLLLLYIHYD